MFSELKATLSLIALTSPNIKIGKYIRLLTGALSKIHATAGQMQSEPRVKVDKFIKILKLVIFIHNSILICF